MKNKGAFSKHIEELQKQIDDENETPEFAIGVFDCDSLKIVNDDYGHYKGDIYLKTATHTICNIFKHSPVFRIGGDEFIAMIPQIDAEYFSELTDKLRKKGKKIPMAIGAIWQDNAENLETLINSADQLMYNDKAMYYQDNNDRRH